MNVPPETIFSTARPSNLDTVPVPGSANQTLQQIEDAVLAQAQIAKAVEAGTAPAARGARSSRATTVRIEIWSP